MIITHETKLIMIKRIPWRFGAIDIHNDTLINMKLPVVLLPMFNFSQKRQLKKFFYNT